MNNFLNLKVNDIITFTNKLGYKVNITVSRVEEKSWYCGLGGRNSYGRLKNYTKYHDFKITKANNQ